MVRFIFDLDGTLTKKETLPLISEHFCLKEQIAELTMQTVQGKIPFAESFTSRVEMLGKISVSEISSLLAAMELHEELHGFIQCHLNHCVIATGNLWCWVDKLIQKIGCKAYYSQAVVENDHVTKIFSILKKETVVDYYKKQGDFVIFIGDGSNDAEAMQQADIAIATGLTHTPAQGVLAVADYVVYTENELCALLNQFLST